MTQTVEYVEAKLDAVEREARLVQSSAAIYLCGYMVGLSFNRSGRLLFSVDALGGVISRKGLADLLVANAR